MIFQEQLFVSLLVQVPPYVLVLLFHVILQLIKLLANNPQPVVELGFDDELMTIEGLAKGNELHPMQAAFREHHGLQCGFCTPGFLMLAVGVLEREPNISDEDLLDVLSSNLCRCTGYQNIIKAVRAAATEMRK